jgi:O-antigen/teichoic acid export membrane protein
MLYSLTLLTLAGFGLSLFAREALTLLTPPAYHSAATVVPLIVLAYLFFEVYYLLSFGMDLTKKTGYAPFIIGASALINLCLNLILIPRFQMLGAAIATVISYMMLPIIEYPIVRKLYPVPYEWGRLAKLFIVSVGVYVAGVMLKTGHVWIDLAVGCAVIVGWGLILYLLGFFSQRELAAANVAVSTFLQNMRRRFQTGV